MQCSSAFVTETGRVSLAVCNDGANSDAGVPYVLLLGDDGKGNFNGC